MLLNLKSFVLRICHGNNKRTLVGFIGYSELGITWQVDSIKLVEEGDEVVALQSIVDGDDTDASLLQELHMGARYVARLSFLATTTNPIVDR